MSSYLLNGIKTEVNRDIVRKVINNNIPSFWKDNGIEDIIDEVCFRMDGLEFENVDFIPEERYTIACVNYMLEYGDGNPIGIDLLINEDDDGNIFDFL